LLAGEKGKKIVIDLAVPNDFDVSICNSYPVHLIEIGSLQEIAKENMMRRSQELESCNKIIEKRLNDFNFVYKTRKVELAMKEVPQKVKEIREMAINTVFAKDIEQLDEQSKEVLEKVISYFEKKYISVPMKMAKEILLDESAN
jgi:glutamyl-tRNA reductase